MSQMITNPIVKGDYHYYNYYYDYYYNHYYNKIKEILKYYSTSNFSGGRS